MNKSNVYTGSNTQIMADPLSHQALVALSQKKELGDSYLSVIADNRARLSKGKFLSKTPNPEKYYELYSMFKSEQKIHDPINATRAYFEAQTKSYRFLDPWSF